MPLHRFDKERFWQAVGVGLRVLNAEEVGQVTFRLGSNVEDSLPEVTELFYHSDPLDVACDIAGRSLTEESPESLARLLDVYWAALGEIGLVIPEPDDELD